MRCVWGGGGGREGEGVMVGGVITFSDKIDAITFDFQSTSMRIFFSF